MAATFISVHGKKECIWLPSMVVYIYIYIYVRGVYVGSVSRILGDPAHIKFYLYSFIYIYTLQLSSYNVKMIPVKVGST